LKKEITLEKLASIPTIRLVKLNKAGNKVGFYWDKTKRNEFYELDLTTMKFEQVTDGHLPKAIRAGYVWLHDNVHITYTKDKDGDEQHNLYLFNTETKESIQLTDTPKAEEIPKTISPDGKQLVFSSTRHGQLNLFLMNIETHEVQQLTAHDKPTWGDVVWSKDNWIYYDYNDSYNFKNTDVWSIKSDGSEIKKVFSVSDESNDTVQDINKEGTLLAVTSDSTGISQSGVFNTQTNKIKWLSKGNYAEKAVRFSIDGSKLLVYRNHESEMKPVIYEIETGDAKVIDVEGFTFDCIFCQDDKYLLYTRTSPKMPLTFVKYDLQKEVEEIIIPPQTELSEEDLYDVEYIKYPTFDGLKIAATLGIPKLESGKKYPAVIDVHGGPTSQNYRRFNIFAQVFAHNGFVILQPNFRGSTGYGKKFKELIIKDWGGGEAKDIIWGKKFLESLEYVDAEKIGVFGGSYGGYSTFMQLTKYAEEDWKAGSAWIGISHLKKMYDRSHPHFKNMLIQFLGTYEENKELWEDRSAMNHIEKIKAPIQIIHGVHDPRCPIEESRQFRDKLLEMGWQEGKEGEKTFEYVEFEDEGHGAFSDIGMRIRTTKLFIDFFKRRL
jgi:dipeptidyl aminopeptidase/acylaminoacyl peptidase